MEEEIQVIRLKKDRGNDREIEEKVEKRWNKRRQEGIEIWFILRIKGRNMEIVISFEKYGSERKSHTIVI